MDLNHREQSVLIGILRDRERIATQDWNAPIPRERLGAWRMAIGEARQGLVRPNPAAWLGRAPTQAETMALSRTYARLEGLGLVERIHAGGTNRTTHLRLTPAGEGLARRLAGGVPHPQHDLIPVPPGGQPHSATGVGILGGVGEQVGQDLLQPGRVASDP